MRTGENWPAALITDVEFGKEDLGTQTMLGGWTRVDEGGVEHSDGAVYRDRRLPPPPQKKDRSTERLTVNKCLYLCELN